MTHQDDQAPHEDDELIDEIPDIEGEPPPVDEYRLSTRPRSVSGGS